MRHSLIISTFLLSLAWTGLSYAAPEHPCAPLEFNVANKDIVLKTNPPPKASQVVFFTNKSQKSIFIDHPSNGRGMGAGWSSYLRPGHWSALALTRENFTVHCSTIEPGNVITQDCSKVISVCTPKNPVTKTTIKGNFWLTEDKPWDVFIKALEKRGFTF